MITAIPASGQPAGALHRVLARIATSRARHGIVHPVRLIAVSKGQPAERIAALAACGQRAFGENYLAEARRKQAALEATREVIVEPQPPPGRPAGRPSTAPLEWHFIGAVQRNKTAEIAAHFAWVQSVDRELIATRLAGQRPAALPPLAVLIQVNVDREPGKHGIDPALLLPLAAHIAGLPALALRGVMGMPPAGQDETARRRSFARLRACYERLQTAGYPVDTLSMGMTADLEWAIAEGSTMVRVGTALFGPRPARREPTASRHPN